MAELAEGQSMGEKKGRRESIDRMTRQIIESNKGKVSTTEARSIAKDAAIRADRREKKR